MIERVVFTIHADMDMDTEEIVRSVVLFDGERMVMNAEQLAKVNAAIATEMAGV